jgi:hypothetical protein
LESEKNGGKEILSCQFEPRKEDRIIFCSDGIAQTGLGTDKYPLGWGRDNMQEYSIKLVQNGPKISASKLALKLVNMAHQNDGYSSKDDTSCASIYFRNPRKLMIITGPPCEEENDKELGTRVNIAHQDPNLPIELEIRRTVVKRMARLLEEKFLKELTIRYI